MTNPDHKILDFFISFCSNKESQFFDSLLEQLTEGIFGEALSYTVQAAEFIRSNALVDAKHALMKAMDSSANDARIYLNLAGIFASLGEYSHAISTYEHVRRLGLDSAFIDLRLASVYELAQDYSAAEKHYRNALDSKEHHFNAAQGLISVYLSTGRINNAWQEIKNIINLYPKEYEGIHLATALYIMCNMPTKAAELLNEVRPRFHRRILFHYDYIKALICAQEYDAAYEYLSKLDDELINNNLFFEKEKNNILLGLGRSKEAMELLEHICATYSDIESMFLYSTLLLKHGHTDKALDILHQIIEQYRPCDIYFRAMYLCANVLKHTNQLPSASSLFSTLSTELDEAIAQDGHSVPLYILKASCCRELAQPDAAAEFLDKARQLFGNNEIFQEYCNHFDVAADMPSL